MTLNRFLGIALLISTGIGVFGMLMDSGATADVAGGFYTLAGFGFYIFGTWAGIRLVKGGDKI